MNLKHSVHISFLSIMILMLGVQRVAALAKGDRVQTTTSPVMVRTISGSIANIISIGNIPITGTLGTIIDGPLYATLSGVGHTWWKVTWDTGLSGWSVEEVMGKVAAVVPTSPTSLTASGGSSSISLSWMNNASNEQGFKIDRKIGTGAWAL